MATTRADEIATSYKILCSPVRSRLCPFHYDESELASPNDRSFD
jgi:hypothetical protein